ncbi:MAG: bacteriocin [Clostridiales bacterium]|nr:bacteriocin [Clostridiales bacterium]
MWEQIVNLAISNGLFAVMFLGLFIYQLRDSKNRETKYQETISKLGDSLQVVKEVKQDVEMIKEKLVVCSDIKIEGKSNEK